MNDSLKQQIEKMDNYTWVETERVLKLLAKYVCIPRKQLEEYVEFVDNLRTHPKSHVMLVKYQIYKELLE